MVWGQPSPKTTELHRAIAIFKSDPPISVGESGTVNGPSVGLSMERSLPGQTVLNVGAGHANGRNLLLSNSGSNPNAISLSALQARDQEVSRRRESDLSSIVSRYREATELFRAMSLRLDNPREAGSPLSNHLSRIQQAILLAEELRKELN